MALRQQFLMLWPSTSGNATTFRNALANGQASDLAAAENEVTGILPVAGTIRNLRASHPSGLPGDDVAVFAVMKNGSPTACTVTLNSSNQTATDSSNVISYSATDTVSLRRVTTGSPSGATYRLSLEWQPTTANVSVYGFGTSGSNLASGQHTPFFGGGAVWSGSAETQMDVVAVGGTIGGYTINLEAAPGVGNSRTFGLFLNGTLQTGAGGAAGTVDTRLTISDAATSGTATFSLAVSAADRVTVNHVSSGTPTASQCCGVGWFTSSVADTWNFCGEVPTSITTDSFSCPAGAHSAGVGTPESSFDLYAPLSTFSLSGLRVAIDQAPG